MLTIISQSTDATVVYARRELEQMLGQVYAGPISHTPAVGAAWTITLSVEAAQRDEIVVVHRRGETRIAGRTPTALLHGVYRFLEEVGFVFTVRGTVAPEGVIEEPGEFSLAETPALATRGLRQHINFPMDISGYPLRDAMEYVRNLARMKFTALTFQCLNSNGWYHFDHHGYQVGEDPQQTLYYSETHALAEHPYLRSNSPNRAIFAIPEVEEVYQTPAQREVMQSWLRRLIRCAKACGMTVFISIEPCMPGNDAALLAAGLTPDQDTYIAVTQAAVRAILTQYPEIDGIEVFTWENQMGWPVPDSADATWALLAERLQLPVECFTRAAGDDPARLEPARRHLVGILSDLHIAIAVLTRLADDPALQGKRRMVGVYYADHHYWSGFAPIIEAMVPETLEFSLMPAYGARGTALSLTQANLSPALLARTHIYSWCEFDGSMYVQQNECEGLHQSLQCARRDGGRTTALLANHWRNAENEFTISYLAAATYFGVDPRAFYTEHLPKLVGPRAAGELAAILAELDTANHFAQTHFFNIGFCLLAGWSAPRLGWGAWWDHDELPEYMHQLEGLAARLHALLPHVTRPAGLARCRLLLNRLHASRIHCEVIAHIRTMRELMAEREPGLLPEPQRGEFARHATAALEQAHAYVDLCCAELPDRGGEGTLVSYEHVMYTALRSFLRQYTGADDGPALATASTTGPPAPLVV